MFYQANGKAAKEVYRAQRLPALEDLETGPTEKTAISMPEGYVLHRWNLLLADSYRLKDSVRIEGRTWRVDLETKAAVIEKRLDEQ